MYRRTLVIGDIHGYLEAFRSVLHKAEFDPERDRLICLGDYIDGGPDSYKVVEMLISLKRSSPIDHVFIVGNHDYMFRSTLSRLLDGVSHKSLIKELPEDYRDELEATLISYEKHSKADWKRHLNQFFLRLPYYHQEGQLLFVHAGFVPELGLSGTFEKDPKLLLTDRTMYHAGCEAYESGMELTFGDFETIFIGHTPTIRVNERKPIKKGNVLNLDQGIKIGGRLTAWHLESGDYWQTGPVG